MAIIDVEVCMKNDFIDCPCEEFETCISNIKSVNTLKQIRKSISVLKLKTDDSFSGKVADFLVSKVGTMTTFYCFIILATIPLIVPTSITVLGYISSSYLQLILLPLIMVATNRSENIRAQKAEREWKINLLTTKIDELNEEEEIKLQQIEIKHLMKNDIIMSSENNE